MIRLSGYLFVADGERRHGRQERECRSVHGISGGSDADLDLLVETTNVDED